MTQKQHNAKEAEEVNFTQKQCKRRELDWKEIFRNNEDGLRGLVQQVIHEVLESERRGGSGPNRVSATDRGTIHGRW